MNGLRSDFNPTRFRAKAGRERVSEQAAESSPGSLDKAGWNRAGLTLEQWAITLNERPAVGQTGVWNTLMTCWPQR